MDTYLINLKRRPDRLSEVSRKMAELGLPFKIFRAVDGHDDDAKLPDLNRHLFVINQKKQPVRGEIACAASHIAVWRQFLETDEEYALILEDDIDIAPDLEMVQKQMPGLGLDFLNLSSNAPYTYTLDEETLSQLANDAVRTRPTVFERSRRRLWRRLEWRRRWRIFHLHPLPNGHVACECDPAPLLGSGYIVSRRAAEAFLQTTEHLFFPVDLVWRHAPGMLRQGFLARPIVTQTDKDSDIPGRFDQGKIALKYRLLRPFLKSRRLRRRFDVLRLYGVLRH